MTVATARDRMRGNAEAVSMLVRYPEWKDRIAEGDLVRWANEQLKNIVLVDRKYIEAISEVPRRPPPQRDTSSLDDAVTFFRGEFGMFLRWASPSGGNGTREPIVYIPRFARYCTWHGWVKDAEVK